MAIGLHWYLLLLCFPVPRILEMILSILSSKSLLWIIRKLGSTLLVTSFHLEIIPFTSTVCFLPFSQFSVGVGCQLPSYCVSLHLRRWSPIWKCFQKIGTKFLVASFPLIIPCYTLWIYAYIFNIPFLSLVGNICQTVSWLGPFSEGLNCLSIFTFPSCLQITSLDRDFKSFLKLYMGREPSG